MIPDNLLIQTGPIYWIGDFSLRVFLISGIIVCILFLAVWIVRYFLIKGQKNTQQYGTLGIIPEIGSGIFELEAGGLLRQYITQLYLPYHSIAHTASDVSQYVDDKEIVEILGNIEVAQYSGKQLSIPKREQVLGILESLRKRVR